MAWGLLLRGMILNGPLVWAVHSWKRRDRRFLVIARLVLKSIVIWVEGGGCDGTSNGR